MIIDTNDMDRCYKIHKQRFGQNHFDRIITKSVEEMAELIQALMKLKCENSEYNRERVREEFADVLFCLEFLGRGLDFNCAEIQHMVSDRALRVAGLLLKDNV